MIVVIFGQPHSGKSTLAESLYLPFATNIDGDKLRELFSNKDYSREGRIKNLNRASDIAVFLNSINNNVIVSLVYPYKETRDYLNSICSNVVWVYLTYDEKRGREGFHVKDFEEPIGENVLSINTTKNDVRDCIQMIKKLINKERKNEKLSSQSSR